MHTYTPPHPVHSYLREIRDGVVSNPSVRHIRDELLSNPYVRGARNDLYAVGQTIKNELFALMHAVEVVALHPILVLGVLVSTFAMGSVLWNHTRGGFVPSVSGLSTPGGVDRTIDGNDHDPSEPAVDSESDSRAHGTTPSGDDDETLLPPEEYIERVVESNGGRVMQQELVAEMDKSAATVSRYLSRMEDDGRIRRVRVGRRNLVLWPEKGGDELPDGTAEGELNDAGGDVLRQVGRKDGF